MSHDDEPDDAFGFHPPLPPEDRLWRHPSELGPGGAAQPIQLVTRPAPGSRPFLVGTIGVVIGAGAMFGALLVTGALDDEEPVTAVEQVKISVPDDPEASDLAIAEQVLPAVARIEATGPAGARQGTAVVVRSDGVLLTSADAVDGADTIEVSLYDQASVPARLVGIDHDDDVAVVKVDRDGLTPATIGIAGELQLGERTVVISTDGKSPAAATIGVGLVSGLGERVDPPSGRPMHGMIRANVHVSAAATGAPLIDETGAVVGIVTRRGGDADGTGSSNGSGERLDIRYATPIEWAKHLADEFLFLGRVTTVWLGVDGADLAADDVDRIGRDGAHVLEVSDGSPAHEAGLQPGDVVTALDDEPVTTMSSLVVALRYHEPGDVVRVTYLREGQTEMALATLVEKRQT